MLPQRSLRSRACAALALFVALVAAPARGDLAVPVGDLETFLSLPTDTLLGVGNGPVIDGSAIYTTFVAQAGDVLSFDFNLLTNEPQAGGGTINDFAFFSLSNVPGTPAFDFADVVTGATLASSAPGFAFQTGPQSYSITIADPGVVVLGIGVVNVTDDQNDSAVLLDNLVLRSSSLTNGSFESGDFTGFARIGDASVVGPYGTSPTDGSFQALLTTRSVPEPSSLALLGAGVLAFRALNKARRRDA